MPQDSPAETRLDRWLWAARFFKTRSQAATAIDGGKVHLGGHRAKRATAVRVGDELRIRKGPYEFRVVIRALSERRGSSPEAAALFEETAESIRQRARLREELRAKTTLTYEGKGRPTKRDRRRLDRFKKEM
jgi:ribosome-associated heat shock protein Hsp15